MSEEKRFHPIHPRGPGASSSLAVTVENCDREPIHTPGSIQPHGALVAFAPASGVLLHASANLGRWLPACAQSISTLLGNGALEAFAPSLCPGTGGAVRHHVIDLPARPQEGQPEDLTAIVHIHRDIGIAEFEPVSGDQQDWVPRFSDTLEALRSAVDLEDLVERSARHVARLTGLDRVMVYRFNDDWHGHVIADVHQPGMESFIDLHFPASDIPAQARELFRTNPVRYIAEVDSEAVLLLQSPGGVPSPPLDMSHAHLRRASPIHLQYLQNMGVASTLTISLLVEGRLWGLIACHHRTPTALPIRLRRACSALAAHVGFMVGWIEQRQRTADADAAGQTSTRIVEAFNDVHLPLPEVIKRQGAALLQIAGATGGAFWRGDAVYAFGQWPDDRRGASILRHLHHAFETSKEDIYATDRAHLQPTLEASELQTICGFMSIKLDAAAATGIVWLRPELRRDVSWGGDPDKPLQVELDANGHPRLSPRSSFARWETLVKGHCRPWTKLDRSGARALLSLGQVLLVRDSMAQLSLSDSRLRSLVALQSNGYWQIDPHGHVVAFNWPLPAVLGPIEGRTLAELLTPSCAQQDIEGLTRTLADRKPFRGLHVRGRAEVAGGFEIEFNGEPMHDDEGRTAGWHGTVADVTRESALREALRRREIEQQAMLDNDVIAIVKFRDRRIVWKNKAVDRIFGYAPDELYGKSGQELFPDPAGFAALGVAAESAMNAGGSHRAQVTMVCKGGASVWIDIHGMRLSKQPLESLWLLADITPIRQAEDARLEEVQIDAENRQIMEASRLKEVFLANMSHELRTPLNAVISLCELLHVGGLDPESEEYESFLDQIASSGQLLLRLIDELLDFAALEADKFEFRPEPVRMVELVGKALGLSAAASARKRIAITTQVDPTLTDLVIDPLRLKQVVSAYVSNAVKFTPERGRVAIRALADGAHHFRVEVEDSGIGIEPADVPRLFTSFQQLSDGLSKQYEGAGLGLALVRRLVEAQGGTVGVRSTPAVGSVFHLLLPRKPGANESFA